MFSGGQVGSGRVCEAALVVEVAMLLVWKWDPDEVGRVACFCG